MSRADDYRTASQELLRKAREELAQSDLVQASEKGCGAAARAVKALAETRGWAHQNHRDLYVAVGRLVRESGDPTLGQLFRGASSLHANFYENWMPEELVSGGLVDVEQFVSRLD